MPPPTNYYALPLSRRAAVLIVLFADRHGDLRVVLTERSSTLNSCISLTLFCPVYFHMVCAEMSGTDCSIEKDAGQVAFPGGMSSTPHSMNVESIRLQPRFPQAEPTPSTKPPSKPPAAKPTRKSASRYHPPPLPSHPHSTSSTSANSPPTSP